jgi:signal transduction histidine kinase
MKNRPARLRRRTKKLGSQKRSRRATRAAAGPALKQRIEQLARANADLRKKVRSLERVLAADERERKLVAFEIHDTLLQDVLGALMVLEAAAAKGDAPQGDHARRLEQARALLRKSIDGTRRMVAGLRPRGLEEQGVAAAIGELAREFKERGLDVGLSQSLDGKRLSPELESTVYRIVQEGLTNVIRHSRSPRAEVEIKIRAGKLRLCVRDFGVGFNPAAVNPEHFGLEGLKARARLAGGRVTIQSTPGRGTTVTAVLPTGRMRH